MTTLAILSVYDKCAATFGRPFYAPNAPAAVRSLRSEVNNPQAGALFTDPQDFALYEMGVFDDQTGEFTMQVPPQNVVNALDVLKQQPD